MLARCQFDIDKVGRCTATLTYPVKGMPWRRNVMKSFEFKLDSDTRTLLFGEVDRLRRAFPGQCLDDELLWSDTSEMGNAITREQSSGKLCMRLSVVKEGGELVHDFWLREDAPALVSSALFKTISDLLRPHERL